MSFITAVLTISVAPKFNFFDENYTWQMPKIHQNQMSEILNLPKLHFETFDIYGNCFHIKIWCLSAREFFEFPKSLNLWLGNQNLSKFNESQFSIFIPRHACPFSTQFFVIWRPPRPFQLKLGTGLCLNFHGLRICGWGQIKVEGGGWGLNHPLFVGMVAVWFFIPLFQPLNEIFHVGTVIPRNFTKFHFSTYLLTFFVSNDPIGVPVKYSSLLEHCSVTESSVNRRR